MQIEKKHPVYKYTQNFGLLYKCTQKYFIIQVYTKPVHCTSVQKSSLVYKCTQNHFAKLVTNKWNVQGRDITNYLYYCQAQGQGQGQRQHQRQK